MSTSSSLFTVKTSSFTGDPEQDFQKALKMITLHLEANAIPLTNLSPQGYSNKTFKDAISSIKATSPPAGDESSKEALAWIAERDKLFVKNFPVINAKAVLIIFQSVEGSAQTHIAELDYAHDMILKLKQVYATFNPLQHKMARDAFNSYEIGNTDPNAYWSHLTMLGNQVNKCCTSDKGKVLEIDLIYQFIVGVLGDPSLGPLAHTWLIAYNSDTLKLTIPEMIQALIMNRIQEEILTKRSVTLRANEIPPNAVPKRERKRPCKFCDGDHWDKECSKAPDCYRKPFHNVRSCSECQARWVKEKEGK
jgi:hypothetical protein